MKKQHYIPLGKDDLVPVSKEAYLYHSSWIAKERYRARRDHQCANPHFWNCNGDCGRCQYSIPGDVLYMDAQLDSSAEFDIPDYTTNQEETVTNQMMIAALLEKLNELIPYGGQIFKMLAHGYSEHQIASRLGIRQSTLNYQKNKIFQYIHEHRKEWS